MRTITKIGALSLASLGIAVLFVSQQRKINRLAAEGAELRSQLSQMAALQEEKDHLADSLKAAADASQTNQNELLRLRGQMARLRQVEQENTQLKAQRQQADSQAQPPPASQSGEVTALAEARRTGNETPNPSLTDLGILELTDGTPTSFDLGGGTNCIVTPTVLSNGNNILQISIGVANGDGTFAELTTSRVTAPPGTQSSISVGDRMIGLTVKLKTAP